MDSIVFGTLGSAVFRVIVRSLFFFKCISSWGGTRLIQDSNPSKLKSVTAHWIGQEACIRGNTSLRTCLEVRVRACGDDCLRELLSGVSAPCLELVGRM